MHLPRQTDPRAGERGGSRLNLIIILAVIALGAYSAYNYAPVSYHAFLLKDFMQDTVNKASYPPGQSNEWVTAQFRKALKENDLPENAYINVQKESGQITARVQWTRPVKLPGYTYQYTFDHTVRSSGFINQ
jgi:heme A synthase